MARNSTRTNRPAPQPVVGENPASGPAIDEVLAKAKELLIQQASNPEPETETKPETVVSIKGAGTRKSLMAAFTNAQTVAARDKMEVMGVVRQGLAEAADLFKAGTDSEKQAVEVASKAALRLYQARAENLVTPAEVSAALGDEFGYKPKTDGTPGKTPAGQGEAIRKRIVRAASAYDYVMNGDGGTFFQGLPVDDVNSILASMENGDIGFWAAYEAFAQIKRDNATKTIPAFNHKHISSLVDALSEKGAPFKFRSNPELVATYAALVDVIKLVDEAAAELEDGAEEPDGDEPESEE